MYWFVVVEDCEVGLYCVVVDWVVCFGDCYVEDMVVVDY